MKLKILKKGLPKFRSRYPIEATNQSCPKNGEGFIEDRLLEWNEHYV